MNAEPVHWLEQSSFTLTVAVVVVWGLRVPLRKFFGAQAAYAAWLVLPLALAASLLPPRVVVLPPVAMVQNVDAGMSAATQTAALAARFDPQPWLVLAWCAGAAFAAVLLARQQRRFVRALGRVTRLHDGNHRAEHGAGCPAVVGLLPPRLVLPPDFEARYAPHERALILAHERAHLARGDAYANAFAAALRCAFWFHPLIHLAVARFRRDQELACDAAVLRGHPQSRRVYADAMLKTQLAVLGLPVGCHWQSSHPLMERVAMLKHPLPNLARRALGFGVVALSALGGAYAAWAAQPAQTKREPVDVAASRKILASFELRVDGGEASRFKVINAVGEPFSFRSDDRAAWEGEFTVTDTGAGRWRLAGRLKHDGETISRPTLELQDGRQGGIKIGQDDGARLELEVTLTSLSEGAATKVQAAAVPSHKADAAATDHAAREIEGVRLGKPPSYPAAALKQHIEGEIVLRVLVDESGTPRQVDVHSAKAFAQRKADGAPGAAVQRDAADPAVLVDAARAVVWDWRFEPAQHEGKAVQDWLEVPFTFALHKL